MAKKCIFRSYDYNNDEHCKHFLVGWNANNSMTKTTMFVWTRLSRLG